MDDDDDDLIPLAKGRTNRPFVSVICGKLEDLQQYQSAAALSGEVTLLLCGAHARQSNAIVVDVSLERS
jgi:hypothetical protein